MHPQFSTEFKFKGAIFENKYVLYWNTQGVTLMREAISYCLPQHADLSLLICVITKFYGFFVCWFHGRSFKGFSIVFLLPDWLKLNHLKSRMELSVVFSDIFSRHICSIVAETIGVQTTQQVLARKNVQKTTFEAAEMMLGPWKLQLYIDDQSFI